MEALSPATTCVLFLEWTGRRDVVRRICTCGQDHGDKTWESWELALASGELSPLDVEQWTTHPGVGPWCRLLARRHGAVAKAYAARTFHV